MDSDSESDTLQIKKRHKCSVKGCKAAFSRPWKLEAHERKHTGERPFVCDIPDCSKAYTNNSHLKRHKLLHHEGVKKTEEFVCGFEGCRQVLSNKYSLNKHNIRCHNPDSYPFKCAECSEGFKKKSLLRDHIANTHTGINPFQCSVCSETFLKYHLYTRHLSRHKTYECDCGIVFARWTELCEHRRTLCKLKPEPKCIICNRVFSSRRNLKEHAINVHVGESQKDTYFCPYLNCKKSYTLRKNLTQHIRLIHREDKAEQKEGSFKCTEPNCEMVLKCKKNLKQHIENMHNRPRKKKPRQLRKDKGLPKIPMATVVTGFQMNQEKASKTLKESYKKLKRKHINEDVLLTENIKQVKEPETVVSHEDSVNNIESVEIDLEVNDSSLEEVVEGSNSNDITEESDNENEISIKNSRLEEPSMSVRLSDGPICETDLLNQCDEILNMLNDQLRSNPMDELSY